MRTILLACCLLTGLAVPANAHEKGVIHLASKQLPVGGELVAHGEKLPKSARLRLELRGALATLRLGDVKTDSAGAFQFHVVLPPEARAGSYTVVALASDGDKVAQADLALTPAPAASANVPMAEMAGHEAMVNAPGDSARHPTAEPMNVPVETSGAEWVAIFGFIGLGLAAGAGLLAQARRVESERP